jgi:SAM-dependent methyltransferase
MNSADPPTPAGAIIDLYSRHADAFDRLRGREAHEGEWLDRFLARLPAAPEVLDLGCGMGEPIGRYLIEAGARVTGVDASAPLLALARERLPAAEWIEADMRALGSAGNFGGRTFDGVVAWHSTFHLGVEDQRAMFPAFSQIVRPGGALMFTSGSEHGESIGTFEGEPLYHASLDSAEYRRLLVVNGFDVVDHVAHDPTCGGAGIWLATKGFL